MYSKRTLKYISGYFLVVALLLGLACEQSSPQGPEQLNFPVDSLELFRSTFNTPEKCQSCHPNHYDEWESSMHAYAFEDPIFFKLNTIGQVRSNNGLDQFCVKCHSPLATLLKEASPGFDPSQVSELSTKGVHCDVCHTMKNFERGKGISTFFLDEIRRGPVIDPAPNNFHQPQFDARYTQSNICSACHEVIGPNGDRVEQTSTEWDNSPYLAMGLECQNCHMPTYSGNAAVGGPFRDNLHRHYFVGVDIPLVSFPNQQNTIAMVDNLLKNSVTMSVDLPDEIAATDDLEIKITINNDRTGHNVPTGNIFQRQMW
jgi:nitrate/TMAO reductase-like tetraheme cytochrome c subunit